MLVIPRLYSGRSIVSSGVRSCQKTRHYSNQEQWKKLKVLFMGRDEFSCLVLDELYKARDVWEELVVATNPDQRVGRRGSQLSVSPLKLKVESLSDICLEFIPPTKAEFKKWKLPTPFESHAVDSADPPPESHVLVTASFGRILTRKHLSHFQPTRRLNVHPSLLPQYRGPAPIQHALLNGDTETGVCVIEMLPSVKKTSSQKSGIDAGNIWASKSLPQPNNAMFDQMRDVLGREGGRLLVQVLRDMASGREVSPVPQRDIAMRPAPMIELEDAHFDPKASTAEEVFRRWRAIGHQRPTTTFVEVSSGTKRAVQLHDLQVYPQKPDDAVLRTLPLTPGAVVCASPNKDESRCLFIRCEGGGVVSARNIKPEGKPILDAQSFWNGVHGKNKEVRFVGS